jgi:hypothetical protein
VKMGGYFRGVKCNFPLRLVLKSHNYVLISLSLELILVMSHNAMLVA